MSALLLCENSMGQAHLDMLSPDNYLHIYPDRDPIMYLNPRSIQKRRIFLKRRLQPSFSPLPDNGEASVLKSHHEIVGCGFANEFVRT